MNDYVSLLGTKGGPAIRPGSPMPTSNLIYIDGQPVVVDCGLGVSRGLTQQGITLDSISLIFITHMHSDHYLELGPLLHTAWTSGLKNDVKVCGPPGLENYWKFFLKSMQADISIRIRNEGRPDLENMVEFAQIREGPFLKFGDVIVSAIRNLHPPLLDTFAISFKTKNSHVVFGGDTSYMPELANFAKGADLLVHEAMLKEGLKPLTERVGNTDDRLMKHLLRAHTLATDVGKIAKEAEVKALALNHLIPADDPDFREQDWRLAIEKEWSGTLYIGTDGLRINM